MIVAESFFFLNPNCKVPVGSVDSNQRNQLVTKTSDLGLLLLAPLREVQLKAGLRSAGVSYLLTIFVRPIIYRTDLHHMCRVVELSL